MISKQRSRPIPESQTRPGSKRAGQGSGNVLGGGTRSPAERGERPGKR